MVEGRSARTPRDSGVRAVRELCIDQFLAPRHWYILLIDTIQRGLLMATKPVVETDAAEAKLFWNGRSQAVRLPKQFRFEGDRVRVRRMGAGILIEPFREAESESYEQWLARIDALRGDAFLPEDRNQEPAPIREYFE